MGTEQLSLFEVDQIAGTGKLLPWPTVTEEPSAEPAVDGAPGDEPQVEAA
ncbi:hypothetical protein ABZ725_14075 [Streptomyces sp. NPDC006872]